MSSYFIMYFMNETVLISTIEKIKFFFKLYKWDYIEVLDPSKFINKNQLFLSIKTETPNGKYKIAITSKYKIAITNRTNDVIIVSIFVRKDIPSYNKSYVYPEGLNSLLTELFGLNSEVKKVITKTIFQKKSLDKTWN